MSSKDEQYEVRLKDFLAQEVKLAKAEARRKADDQGKPSSGWWKYAVLFGVISFLVKVSSVDFLELLAWTVWSGSLLFQKAHRCYYKNPLHVKLFSMIETRDLDRSVRIPATPLVEIQAKDYSIKALEMLSRDWTQPVIVRGLFADSPALQKWVDADYLINNAFGSYNTSVIHNGTIVKHYEMVCGEEEPTETFSEDKPFDSTIRRIMKGSTETIVYPPASRSKRVREMELEKKWNELVKQDLDLTRIGPMFADQARSTVLTQMFLGGGVDISRKSNVPIIGTGWHGDVCNNFVVQISGVKKWIMVDPKYSKYMRPSMRNGKTAIVGGHISIEEETMPYFPRHEFVLNPGDFLYNPEWYWHSIQNHPVGPYAFGLVSRQCHILRNLKQASVFTGMVTANHIYAAIFDVEARMRIWALFSGESLMQPEKAINVDAKLEARNGYT